MKIEYENSSFLTDKLKGKRIGDSFIEKIEFQKRLTYHDFQKEELGLLKYRVFSEEGTKEVYGFYSNKKKSFRLTNKKLLLSKLEEYNFQQDNLRITKLLGFYPKLNLFLREGAEGKTLFNMIENNDSSLEKAIKYSAYWIARLHSLKPKKQVFSSSFKIDKKYFKIYEKIIKKVFPRENIKEIAINSLKVSKQYSSNIITHGDFQPQNIIYEKNEDTITVIDFDWSSINDPLSDIGSFFLQIDYKAFPFLEEHEIIKLKEHFLSSYIEKMGPFQDLSYRINNAQAKFAIQRASYLLKEKDPLRETEQKETALNLIKKAKHCLKDKNLNLKVFSCNFQI